MANVTPRSLALECLLRIAGRADEPLDSVLPALYEAELSAPDKGFARQLLMTTLRHHGQLAAMVASYLDRPLDDSLQAVDWLLRMGAAQLLLLQTPPHAAIDTSVQLCKGLGFVHQAGMVNAVLRKIATEKPEMPPATYNLSSWMKGAWRKAYGGEAADAIAAQCLREPPLDLSFIAGAQAAFSQGESLLDGQWRMPVQDVTKLEGYERGAFWVQDVSATMAVRALGDVAGKNVLDICAAPGGKTLQLCAGGAQVFALDKNAMRLRLLSENLQRCRFEAELIEADATRFTPSTLPDAVLLDAPCSATGTARRHPDMWLRKKPQDVSEMVALQRQILAQVMTWLPAGAVLVYAVCSLEPEEGEAQAAWLEQTFAELEPEPFSIHSIPQEWQPAAHQLRTLPHYWSEKGGMDGFFVAKWRRKG